MKFLSSLLSLTGLASTQFMSAQNDEVRIGPANIDLKPFNKELGYWDEYFNRPDLQEDLFATGMGLADAFNQAKMRIDIQGAKIFRPLMDAVKLIQDTHLVGKDCDSELMF